MTEKQGEQIIELLKQLDTRLSDMTQLLDAIKREISSIHLRAIKIDTKL